MQPLEIQVAFKKLVQDLLGKPVSSKGIARLEPSNVKPLCVSVYTTESGSLAGIIACEIKVAAYLGAALSMIPANVAEAAGRSHKLEGTLLENYEEVANICAQIIASCGHRRVSLDRTDAFVASLPPELTAPESNIAHRADFTVEIQAYGSGSVSVRLFA